MSWFINISNSHNSYISAESLILERSFLYSFVQRCMRYFLIFLLPFAFFCVEQGEVEKYNHLTRTIHREETFSSSKTGAIHTHKKSPVSIQLIERSHVSSQSIRPLQSLVRQKLNCQLVLNLQVWRKYDKSLPYMQAVPLGHKFVLPIIQFVHKDSDL